MIGKICIISEGITGLILSKVLLDLGIKIELVNSNFFKKDMYSDRTVAISNDNFHFLKKNKILSLKKKDYCSINEIKIYNTGFKKPDDSILKFNDKKKPIFYVIKNKTIFSRIIPKIKNHRLLSVIKKENIKNFFDNKFFFKKYDLVINCSNSNKINNKFFYKKIKKNYKSISITTTIRHKKLLNNVAYQYFTEEGPMAFLPVSEIYTSIVWSVNLTNKKNKKFLEIKNFKKKVSELFFNKSKILSFSKINKFNLNFSTPRDYYKNNVLNFGDGLHQIHPLAGQGLNMIIRDINVLKLIIEKKTSLGLGINQSVLDEFENKSKSYNFVFAKGIDFSEKYLSNNKILNQVNEKLFKVINKNFYIKSFFMKIADKGINY